MQRPKFDDRVVTGKNKALGRTHPRAQMKENHPNVVNSAVRSASFKHRKPFIEQDWRLEEAT